jgi:hypothetical protein
VAQAGIMRAMRVPGCLIVLAVCAGWATATPAPAPEIAALLDTLGSSGCRFERNGRWHGAGEARAHLQSKLDAARARGPAIDVETFVDQIASASSLTGRPYRVQCGADAPVPSGPWLHERLRRLRAGGAP